MRGGPLVEGLVKGGVVGGGGGPLNPPNSLVPQVPSIKEQAIYLLEVCLS